jgi:hypothetical protein
MRAGPPPKTSNDSNYDCAQSPCPPQCAPSTTMMSLSQTSVVPTNTQRQSRDTRHGSHSRDPAHANGSVPGHATVRSWKLRRSMATASGSGPPDAGICIGVPCCVPAESRVSGITSGRATQRVGPRPVPRSASGSRRPPKPALDSRGLVTNGASRSNCCSLAASATSSGGRAGASRHELLS